MPINLNSLLKSGISIGTQQPDSPEDGPLSPSLEVLASTFQERYPHSKMITSDEASKPISLVGAELVKISTQRKVRVIFTDTGGSAIAPWRGTIILDFAYRGDGQISSPATIAKVAHELTHLLQRRFNQPHYWPSGGLRLAFGRRWIGDSTNFMEVIAYIVGFTVEYDLIAAQRLSPQRSSEQLAEDKKTLKSIQNHLATFTSTNPRNACRLVLKLFPENQIYRQNYEVEERTPDGRIPPGSWHQWFRELGFTRQAVDHVMILALRGRAEWIEVDQIT